MAKLNSHTRNKIFRLPKRIFRRDKLIPIFYFSKKSIFAEKKKMKEKIHVKKRFQTFGLLTKRVDQRYTRFQYINLNSLVSFFELKNNTLR
jgi:hypothetical protein